MLQQTSTTRDSTTQAENSSNPWIKKHNLAIKHNPTKAKNQADGTPSQAPISLAQT